jgi:hypothetical protein
MNQPPLVPAAKAGDELDFRLAVAPIIQAGLLTQLNECVATGLFPKAADGARVAIGAGLRKSGVQQTVPLLITAALLTPDDAMEVAMELINLAVMASTLRGRPLKRPEVVMPTAIASADPGDLN